MFGVTCGIVTTVVGAVLVLTVSLVGYVGVPVIIENLIAGETVLFSDTIQLERFETIPFPLNFTVRVWNISNPDEVLAGGVPALNEVGPYVYKVYQRRVVQSMEGDLVRYRIVLNFEFDAEVSFPHTENDMVTIVNVPYNAILQVAEAQFGLLMPALAAGLNGIFGAANNRPIIDVRVRDLLFDGIPLCANPGVIGSIACTQVRSIGGEAQNLEIQEDGSLLFSLLKYRNGYPSGEYVVHRGIEDSSLMGIIKSYESLPHVLYWQDAEGQGRGSGVCNMLNGTDSGVFPPFVDRNKPIFALNTDICRSVELRYQRDLEYQGIPVARFSANEWFLANDEGCFCLNVTRGISNPDGCLLQGAMEIFTCVGAFLVLTYPHFLYADALYRNGVVGMGPIEEEHRIFLDLEPNTGTVIRGMKRAQFNVFLRPIAGIPATQNLRTTLTPIVWVEEGMSLPDEFVEEVTTKLLTPLNLVAILIPVLVAVTTAFLVIGVVILIWAKRKTTAPSMPTTMAKNN